MSAEAQSTQAHLKRGAPILGTLKHRSTPLTRWMASVSDTKPVVSLNIPGTHDTAAWNYTGASNEWYNCQARPIFDQLDGGIRLFDLRFGYSGTKLVFYHADALLSPTAELEDIFYGFYAWLDLHPSEALFVSLKVDNGPTDAKFQETVFDLLTSGRGKKYWAQRYGELGTLRQCRKKITLLRRFDWSLLPPEKLQAQIGIDLSHDWADNNPNFSINYTPTTTLSSRAFGNSPSLALLQRRQQPTTGTKIAYIEDYYEIGGDPSDAHKISEKFNATIAHIDQARSTNLDQFYISFASGAGMRSLNETGTPKVLAVGSGPSTPGVNQLLLQALQDSQRKGGRFGAVLLDFFDSTPGLVEAIIGGSHAASSYFSHGSS